MPDQPDKKAKPRRRWPWLLAGLAAAVAAGPTLIGFTPIPQSVIAAQLPPEAGSLTATAVTLGWTGPIRVTGLEVRDPAGAVVASIESAEVAGGLIGVATGGGTPLVARVVRPRIDLVVTAEGTNFDPIVAALEKRSAREANAAPDRMASTSRRPIDLTIEGAAVLVTDASSGAQWLLDEVNAQIADPGLGIDAIAATAEGKLTAKSADNPPPGVFSVRLGAAEGGGRLAQLNADGLPLSLVEPLLRRTDPSASLAGAVRVEGQAAWNPSATPVAARGPADLIRSLAAGGLRSSGLLTATQLAWSGAAAGDTPLRLASIEVPWRVTAEGDSLRLAQLDLTSEIGRASVTGSVGAAETERWVNRIAAAPRDLTIDAQVNLAPLARLAPTLLRIQEDAQIDGGRVRLKARCDAGRVTAQLATESIEGVAQGRRVALRQPIDVRVAATQQAPEAGVAGWKLDRLKAGSSFFESEASGGADSLSGDASFDLDRLAAELRPLIDLGDIQLTGTGEAQFAVARDIASSGWRLNSQGRVRNLLVGPPAAPLAAERELGFKALLSGDARGEPRLPSGRITLTAGEDRLVVELPPAREPGAQAFEVRLAGDAARWYRRAAGGSPQLPAPEDLELAGQINLDAAGAADARGGRLDRCSIDLSDLSLDTSKLNPGSPRRLRGERLAAKVEGTWRVADGVVQVLQITQATLASSVASAGATDVLVSLERPDESSGRIDWQADLARLAAWSPPSARYATRGRVRGTALIRGVPEGINAKLKVNAQELTLIDRQPPGAATPQTVWSEPTAKIDADVMLTSVATSDNTAAGYALDVRDARVASQSLTGSFGGQVADLATLGGVQLGGGVDYDLEKLTPILWPKLGDSVRLVGRDRATFRVETDESAPADVPPLARLRASVSAPWEGADLFGLPVGPGRFAGRLERGVLTVDPIDVAIGGGRLTTAATATLDPAPGTLAVPPGPMVTEVAVSQEVNERILKFIAPILADATRIDGRFSVSLRELAVPLAPPPTSGPPRGRAAGVLDIHEVQVRPGPSVAEWVGVVRQIADLARDGARSIAAPRDSVLLSMRDTPVEFQMIDGRVYHRGLSFTVGDAVVESSGSVGVDETLDLVLSVPIQDAWIERQPVFLGRLRGQALRIPIQGTFQKPKVNSDAFRQLSSQVIESAAQGAIEGGLNLLFEKLRSR